MNDTAFGICASGVEIQIAYYLASELDDKVREEALQALKSRVLNGSLGGEEEQVSWLKSLFCESPLIASDMSADEVIRLFTFLLTKLYPEIKGHFHQEMCFAFLTDVELVIKQIHELIHLTSQQHNMLLRLQGMTLSRLGYELTHTTNRKLAREKLTAALKIMEGLFSVEPDNTSIMRTLSNVYENFGHLEKDIAPTEALAWFKKSAGIRETMLGSKPDDLGCMDILADSYRSIGDVLEFSTTTKDEGDFFKWFWKSYLLNRRVVSLKPENEVFQYSLSLDCERIGNYRMHKKPGKALIWFKKSYAIKKRQFEADRSSRNKLDAYWVGCIKLGETFVANGSATDARTWLLKALELAEKLHSLDQNCLRYNGILALSCLRLAELFEQDYPEKARGFYFRSHKIIDALLREGFRSIDYYRLAIEAIEGLERLDDIGDSTLDAIKWSDRKKEIKMMLEGNNSK